MIIFYTMLTEKYGMGNYIRTKQIFNIIRANTEAFLFVQIDKVSLLAKNENEFHNTAILIRSRLNAILNTNHCVLVSDLPFVNAEDCDLHNHKNIKKVIVLNDATVHLLRVDYYINTDDLIEPPIGAKSYIGDEYQIIREDLLYVPASRKRNIINKIGVMFGGSDPARLTETFIKSVLQQRLHKHYEFIVLIGEKFDTSRLNWFLELKTDGISVRYKYNVLDFYQEIDALVNMGGMSTYESVYLGIPVFTVEWSYMKPYAVSQAARLGIHLLGDIEHSVSNLNVLLENANINFDILDFRKKIDGLGSKRIAEIILKACDEK